MFAKLQLRLIFLSLFISSVLLPMEDISIKSNKARRQNVRGVARQGNDASCGYHSILNSVLSLPGRDENQADKIINDKFAREYGAWRACIIKMRKEKLVKNYIKNLLHKYMPHNRELSNDEKEALNKISNAYGDAYISNENLNILKENVKNIPAQLEKILLERCPQISSPCHAERDKQRTYLDNCRACIQIIDLKGLTTEIAHANTLIQQACAFASPSDLFGDNLDTAEMEALKIIAFKEYDITDDCITIIDNTTLLENDIYQGKLNPAKQQMLNNNVRHAFCIRTTDNIIYNQKKVDQLIRTINDVTATPEEKDAARKQQTAMNRELSADTEPTHWISVTLDRKNGQNTYLIKDSMGGDYTNHDNLKQLIDALEPEHIAQANLNPTGKSDSKSNAEPSEPKVSTSNSQEHKLPEESQPAQPQPVQGAQPNPIQDEREKPQQDQPNNTFDQEKAFHKRLQERDLIPDGAQAYYKKITPITSDPIKRAENPVNTFDQWEIVTVSIEGQRIRPTANGVYTHKDIGISFTIPAADFNPTQFLNTEVTHKKGRSPIRFAKHKEEKTYIMPRFGSYNALLDAMNNNRLIHSVTLKGRVDISGEKPCSILIECTNQYEKSIKLRGMEIVCIKNTGETKLFFDFIDHKENPIDDFNTITCKQAKVTVDNMVVRIKNNKMYECDVQGFFDSPETRKNWVPDESNFYKLCPDDETQNKMTSLPGFYDNSKKRRESIVWAFGEKHNSLYQIYGFKTIKNTNEYIYHKEGAFFVTLPYNELYKDCFSNKIIILNYLEQVPQPRILIQPHVLTKPDLKNTEWPTGVYECTQGDNKKPLWQRIGTKDSILFLDNEISFDIEFPTDSLTTQQNKKYCDAAQRFFIDFKANIHSCNQGITYGLRGWNKLTQLNLSKLQLENGVTWNNVLTAVGTMTQLKSLHFGNNHPITNFFSVWTFNELAGPASDYYRDLGICLGKLTNLEELHIQGLWLKPHGDLGSGCVRLLPRNRTIAYSQNNQYDVSTEVATLTGIINRRQQAGVKAIINSICALPFLENLSIDGIPNHGSSDYARKTDGQKFLFTALWITTSYFQNQDGWLQDAALKQLVIDSADQLAQIATLKTISIYSPGGNCVNYFSKAFRDRLDQSRKANKTLPELDIIPKDLQ